MTAYTIRPLEWLNARHSYYAEAKSLLGWFHIRESSAGLIWECPNCMARGKCESIDDGKAKAEAYYRERLLTALVPVPDGAQVVDVHYNPNPEGRT